MNEKKKRVLSSLLMASTMSVSAAAAMDQQKVDELSVRANKENRQVRVIDSQSNWQRQGVLVTPVWGRVWGKVTWLRAIQPEEPINN